jgi:glutaredoxin-like YruB-family protein
MEIKNIRSYQELMGEIGTTGKGFLLMYKADSEQSICALNRLKSLDSDPVKTVLGADVSIVRDIHEKLNLTTVPSLVSFSNGRLINIYKGCQTESAYRSILEGRSLGATIENGAAQKNRKNVTVYTTPSCSWCTTLKTYLKEHQVHYREVDIASDTAAAESMVRKSGQQGVPQTEINGQMIVGFDKNRINQLLEI